MIIHIEETFPFRPHGLIDKMIIRILENGYDTLIAGKLEPGWMWRENKYNEMVRIDSGDQPRIIKEKSYIGLHGICCITYPEFIRTDKLIGHNIGLYEINEPLSHIEIRDKETLSQVKSLFK